MELIFLSNYRNFLIPYVFLCFCAIFTSTEFPQTLQCFFANNCSSCIDVPDCAWCMQENFKSKTGRRCAQVSELLKNGCKEKNIYNPKNKVLIKKKINDEEIPNLNQKYKNELNDEFKLLLPEKVKLKVRPNTKVRFKVLFKQPEKYPVDIYYLMDLTWSMKDHLRSLVRMGSQIADSMHNITSNFRLGFGSFIDKVIMPYSNMLPHKLKNPCKESFDCVPAYGFRNHLPLTKNANKFISKVQQARLSGNLDNAEGGFDAIMQVIMCKKEINWNKMARKIILFATDSIFHYAGDGKLGGIIKANDGKCHLDDQGYYTESLQQDYPTLQQINKAIVNNQINVIFSVPKSALNVYEILSQNLEGSVSGELAEDSHNIVQLIQDNYQKIVSTIELKDNASKALSIKYFTKCLDLEGKMKESHICNNVGVGKEITFELEIDVKNCEHYLKGKNFQSKYEETFVVFPIGVEQYVEVQLQLMCGCDCEQTLNGKEKCHKNGDFICGECHCQNNFFGKKCECDANDLEQRKNEKSCLRNGKICSGKGVCECGKCICDRKKANEFDRIIFGTHCEFDSFSCQLDKNGQICSGNGNCLDGQCDCSDKWSGENCECTLDQKTCIDPVSEKICSGNGECVCGKCKCHRNKTNETYSGRLCGECLNCEDECVEHDACVACKLFKSGPLRNHCSESCQIQINAMNLVKMNSTLGLDLGPDMQRKRCIMVDENNCQYQFVYNIDLRSKRKYIDAANEKICQRTVLVVRIVSLIICLVLLIGILCLIIWKLVSNYQDKKKYQEWLDYLKKRQLTAEVKNPIYQAPKKNYQNPIYESPKMSE